MTTVRDLSTAEQRALRAINKKPVKKMTPVRQSLFDKGLLSQSLGNLTEIRTTAEGARLCMELSRIERMMYTIDSDGKKTRRKFS